MFVKSHLSRAIGVHDVHCFLLRTELTGERSKNPLTTGQGFSTVCFHRRLSFCSRGRGCLSQCMLGYTPPWADTPRADTPLPGQTPPLGQTLPPGRHPPGQTPPWAETPEIATAADSTYLTGMHSCFQVRSNVWMLLLFL